MSLATKASGLWFTIRALKCACLEGPTLPSPYMNRCFDKIPSEVVKEQGNYKKNIKV